MISKALDKFRNTPITFFFSSNALVGLIFSTNKVAGGIIFDKTRKRVGRLEHCQRENARIKY